MTRSIHCRECTKPFEKQLLGPEDRALGWKARAVFIVCRPDKCCDMCGRSLDGEVATAITRWNKREGDVPGMWEHCFGNPLPYEAVEVLDALVGGAK